MRTTLLFALAVMIGFSAIAQKSMAPRQKVLKPSINQPYQLNAIEKTVQPGTTNKPAPRQKSAAMVELVPMGSSVNVFSILTSGQRGMAYDPGTNTLMHTHRGDQTTPGFQTGNDVAVAYSDDNGATFVEKLAYQGSNTERCRYPSGVIYNPAGNTLINNVYSVVAGPVTNGSGWIKTFYGSRTYDGNNANQQAPATTANGELIRNGMFATQTGLVGIGETQQLNDGNGYTDLFGFTSIGNFNGSTNSFDWDFGTWDPQEFIYFDPTNGWYRSWSASYQMAFSADGSIGYRWTDGVDNRATNGSSFYPIVYKTTDGGATWNVLDFFDFGQLPDVYAHLINLAAEDRVAPWFQESDGVVDYKGNLHLFARTVSAASLHVDSLTYIWNGDYGQIFEFEFDHGSNQWMATWCDSLRTEGPSSGTSGNSIYGTGADNTGWDMRVHASITPDGKKVFGIWTDTDDYAFWGQTEALNNYPDLKVWGHNLENNTFSDAHNMTYEGGAGAAWGACYFTFTSPVAVPGEGYTTLPTSIADIATNGYDPNQPVFHYYLKGVDFDDAWFIYEGVKESAKSGNVVTACYPNPFSGSSQFSVNLDRASKVSVTISTITGQQVSTTNYGTLGAGINNLTIDGSNLSSGIYFYTVTIGTEKYTNKFIIK